MEKNKKNEKEMKKKQEERTFELFLLISFEIQIDANRFM